MADVCLMLEGTYPYVSGGVSACAHQLITMLAKTEFSLVYLGTTSSEFLKPKYKLPPNVSSLQEVFLFDEVEPGVSRDRKLSKTEVEALRVLHGNLHQAPEGGNLTPLSGSAMREALEILFPFQAPLLHIYQYQIHLQGLLVLFLKAQLLVPDLQEIFL